MTITVATGAITERYRIIDTVAGVGSSKTGWGSGPSLDGAFDECKKALRARAQALGADAVIHCDFELRNYDKGIEVVAFGTAVKIIETV